MNGGLETVSPAAMPVDRRTSRLTWLYISALTAVAALSITGQLLVQRSLHQQRGDSTIVNIAGRQRMLSQKLTKAALAWSHATAPVERENRAEEIRGTLAPSRAGRVRECKALRKSRRLCRKDGFGAAVTGPEHLAPDVETR